MTNKEAQEIYDQTGNLKDFLINNIDAYKQELATNKKISQTKFHHMKTTILLLLFLSSLKGYGQTTWSVLNIHSTPSDSSNIYWNRVTGIATTDTIKGRGKHIHNWVEDPSGYQFLCSYAPSYYMCATCSKKVRLDVDQYIDWLRGQYKELQDLVRKRKKRL